MDTDPGLISLKLEEIGKKEGFEKMKEYDMLHFKHLLKPQPKSLWYKEKEGVG